MFWISRGAGAAVLGALLVTSACSGGVGSSVAPVQPSQAAIRQPDALQVSAADRQPASNSAALPAGKGRESILFRFPDETAGQQPSVALAIDATGNIFGTTRFGGGTTGAYPTDEGVAYELTPGTSGYTEQVLYVFSGIGGIGGRPGPVSLDARGNLWGASRNGVFELVKASAYEPTLQFPCQGSSEPQAGVTLSASDVYFQCGNSVIELTPGRYGTYFARTLYSFPTGGVSYIQQVEIDRATCNIYGVEPGGGANNAGFVFALTAVGGCAPAPAYTESDLYDFAVGSSPNIGVTLAPGGVILGSTMFGGPKGMGMLYQLTPGSSGYTESTLFSPTWFGGISGLPVRAASGALIFQLDGIHIVELTPSTSGYIYNQLSYKTRAMSSGRLRLDSAGNVYGASDDDGTGCHQEDGCGEVFKITQ